jgi:hypothetical protein
MSITVDIDVLPCAMLDGLPTICDDACPLSGAFSCATWAVAIFRSVDRVVKHWTGDDGVLSQHN